MSQLLGVVDSSFKRDDRRVREQIKTHQTNELQEGKLSAALTTGAARNVRTCPFSDKKVCSLGLWDREIGNQAKMIAGPDPVDRFVKDLLTGGDLEGRPTVLPTAYEEVINAPEGPIPIGKSHERVLGGERLAWFPWMEAFPDISVANTHATQRLTATPEADAGSIRIGIQVTSQYYMQTCLSSVLFDDPRCVYRLQLAWKYALSRELCNAGFDHTVLSEFRARLVEGKAEQRLLDLLLQRCQEQGWVKARGRQRTDSTHVLAKTRRLTRTLRVAHIDGLRVECADPW
jgi:hypothetical protein